MPVQSLKDLIALAKAKPRSLNYGSTGVGSTANMAGALLNSMAGIQLVHDKLLALKLPPAKP